MGYFQLKLNLSLNRVWKYWDGTLETPLTGASCFFSFWKMHNSKSVREAENTKSIRWKMVCFMTWNVFLLLPFYPANAAALNSKICQFENKMGKNSANGIKYAEGPWQSSSRENRLAKLIKLMLKMQMAQVHWPMSGRDAPRSRTRHFVAGKFNSTNQEQKKQINKINSLLDRRVPLFCFSPFHSLIIIIYFLHCGQKQPLKATF